MFPSKTCGLKKGASFPGMETTPFLCSSFLSMASAYVAILLYMAIRAGVGAVVLVLPLLVRPGRLD